MGRSGTIIVALYDVLGGLRKSAGMASFKDILSQKDADAIHAYLISRAQEDWGHQGEH
jgi:mono/diheme cytochrome c family protein